MKHLITTFIALVFIALPVRADRPVFWWNYFNGHELYAGHPRQHLDRPVYRQDLVLPDHVHPDPDCVAGCGYPKDREDFPYDPSGR